MSKSSRKAANRRKQRNNSGEKPKSYGQLLQQALEWFASGSSLQDLSLHGNVTWRPVQLVMLAVLWAWSDRGTLTGAFGDAQRLSLKLFGFAAVNSYQGLMKALRAYGAPLLNLLWPHLHSRMEQVAGQHWRIGEWLALAVDGSRITTPRTVSNEQAFGTRNYGRGRKAKSRAKWKNKRRRSKKISQPVKPQIWLTLIWHMGLKLPWTWRTGPSTASERGHLMEMLNTQKFPESTLFCGDAGFVGYEFWSAIIRSGNHFLIRVGANVRLLKKLGTARQRSDLVYLWPNKEARKKQPPLVLRALTPAGKNTVETGAGGWGFQPQHVKIPPRLVLAGAGRPSHLAAFHPGHLKSGEFSHKRVTRLGESRHGTDSASRVTLWGYFSSLARSSVSRPTACPISAFCRSGSCGISRSMVSGPV